MKHLYIAPYFKIFKRNLNKSAGPNEFVSPTKKVDLNTILLNFYLKDLLPTNLRADYNMIFILGQPGQGKTSLCYKFIYDILTNSAGIPSTPLFFIKIRDLHAKDFVNDTFQTIQRFIQQNVNFETEKCMLVLDGLDEAYMSGGITDNDLKNLYEKFGLKMAKFTGETSNRNQLLNLLRLPRDD